MANNILVKADFDKVAKAMKVDAKKTEKAVSEAVGGFAYLITAKAQEKIQKGKRTGVIAKRSTRTWRRAGDGEPPKTDTGILVSSIHPTIVSPFSAKTGSLRNIAMYGDIHEQGNHPWLKPTLEENRSMLGKMMDTALKSGGLLS